MAKEQAAKPPQNTAPAEEMAVIDRLNSVGIYAVAGTSVKPAAVRVDVLAWGFIKIEVRSSQLHPSGHYQWHVHKPSASHQFIDNQFVVLVAREPVMRFFVFSPFSDVFYHNGVPKRGVCWFPNGNHHRSHRKILTDELMICHEDRWDWVNQYRDMVQSCRTYDMPNRMFGTESAA